MLYKPRKTSSQGVAEVPCSASEMKVSVQSIVLCGCPLDPVLEEKLYHSLCMTWYQNHSLGEQAFYDGSHGSASYR